MTIGDVLAVTAAVTATGAAWIAAILVCALAFPARAAVAQTKITRSPGACAVWGGVTLLVGGLLAAVCVNAAAGPLRLLAGVIAGMVCLGAALGSAGIVRLLADRIAALGTPMLPFGSLTRAAVLYVLAGFLPGIGWFFVLPAALLLSLGGGVLALWPARVRHMPALTEIEAAA